MCGMSIEPRNCCQRSRRGRRVGRMHHAKCRHARHSRYRFSKIRGGLPGSENTSRTEGNSSEAGRSSVWPGTRCPGSASGRRRAVADDERTLEVGFRRSSDDVGEQGGLDRCGVGGAKAGNQGEFERSTTCRTQRRVSGVTTIRFGYGKSPGLRERPKTLSSLAQARPAGRPEIGAVCLERARTDLCGGRRVTGVPTATFCRAPLTPPAAELLKLHRLHRRQS
jgi:hypothetical protein